MEVGPDGSKPTASHTATVSQQPDGNRNAEKTASDQAERQSDGDGPASLKESAPEELVSEEALDADEFDASLDESNPAATTAAAPAHGELAALGEALDAAGFTWEASIVNQFLDSPGRIDFDLPAGRSTRPVTVDAMDARRILRGDIGRWRSLERYDGIWNSHDGVIEVTLRPERSLTSHGLRRVIESVGRQETTGEPDTLASEIIDDESGIAIRIGEASEFAAVLLSGRRLYRSRPPITLRIWPVSVTNTADADALIERVTDSVSLDLGISIGISIIPQRLENRSNLRRIKPLRNGRVSFPRNRYPHAPVSLYQAGRDPRTSPLIRYWCFYQVLEYFFPSHNQAAAVKQLSRHLRSPRFDPHSEEDVVRAVQLATAAGRGYGSEEEQLHTTLQAIVTAHEVATFLDEVDLRDQLSDRRSELSAKVVSTRPSEDLLLQLAQRIYDIRCRIVHSKSGRTGEGAGLLPGTHHDDLVRHELMLLEFLAQQALIASADRISLPRL